MQTDLQIIDEWLKNNLLVLNTGKTKFMIPCRSTRAATAIRNFNVRLYIDGEEIHQVDDYIYLGLHIDNILSWDLHIDKIKRCITPYVFALN